MNFREPTKLHRKSGMWGARRPVAGIEPKRDLGVAEQRFEAVVHVLLYMAVE
jgi:hypothetical protein